MVQRVPRPDKSTPLMESDGKTINQAWFDYLSYVDRQLLVGVLGQPDVDNSTPIINTQVLIFNAASGKFKPGAN
jgi:hypothetical protein